MTATLTRPSLADSPARTIWALGDYARVAHEVIPTLGATLTRTLRVAPGERVLDLGAGDGNASFPAARAGARVVAADITPELLARGQERAREQGIDQITWDHQDVQALTYSDASFDVVLSSVGAMFAPNHEATASEMLRVTRPGGRLGFAHWTPEGFIGQMFAAMKPYAAPPAPGATPPPKWGDEAHVRTLLGEGVSSLTASRRTVTVDLFSTPEAFVDYFRTFYGPTIATFRRLAGEPEKAAELHAALVEVAARFGAGRGAMAWEYLLVAAERA